MPPWFQTFNLHSIMRLIRELLSFMAVACVPYAFGQPAGQIRAAASMRHSLSIQVRDMGDSFCPPLGIKPPGSISIYLSIYLSIYIGEYTRMEWIRAS